MAEMPAVPFSHRMAESRFPLVAWAQSINMIGEVRTYNRMQKYERSFNILRNLLLLADTAEKWTMSIDMMKWAELNFDDKWIDFSSRETVLAEFGKLDNAPRKRASSKPRSKRSKDI